MSGPGLEGPEAGTPNPPSEPKTVRHVKESPLADTIRSGWSRIGRAAAHPVARAPGHPAARPILVVAVLLVGLAHAPSGARAQQGEPGAQQPDPAASFHASPYLEMGSWEYQILDYWIASGRINSLSPFTQPYRRMDVARAIRAMRGEHLKPFEERWLRRFQAEFRPELATLDGDRRENAYLTMRASAGAADWTQTSRDPLLPKLHGQFARNRILERVSLDFGVQAGPLAAGLSGVRDGIYRHDAGYPNGRVIPKQDFLFLLHESGIRVEQSYAELQTRYARISVGRMYRNWGAPHMLGFLLSDYAYSWNQVGWRIGSNKIFATGLFASFNDFPGDTTRYFAVHRLEWRARPNLMLAVSESIVEGGPNARLDFRLLNPIGPWQLTTKESNERRNNAGELDAWWRPVNGLALSGSFMAGSGTSLFQKTDAVCCQFGGTFGIEMPGIARGWSLRLQGTELQSLVYRTRLPWEQYTVADVGLGWDKGDFRLGTIEATWLGGDGLVLKPRIDIQQKGTGDFHGRLRPPPDSIPGYPTVIVGQAETTIRPALAGEWHRQLGSGWTVDMNWDVGVDFIRDFQHVKGRNATALVGLFRVMIRTPRLLFGLD